MDIKTVATPTEQDLREHRLIARIEALEAEVAELEFLLWQAATPEDEQTAVLH